MELISTKKIYIVLSFGNRKQIVKKCRELDDLLDNKLYKFIKDGEYYLSGDEKGDSEVHIWF